jgi:hypothetical protein
MELELKKTIITLKCINKIKGVLVDHIQFSMKTFHLHLGRTITKVQPPLVAVFREIPRISALPLSNIHNLPVPPSNSSGRLETPAPII